MSRLIFYARAFFCLWLFSGWSLWTFADTVKRSKQEARTKEETENVDDQSEGEAANAQNFDFLFKNPAVINGLTLGTDTINRSIDSLMENVFYSLLDNEFRFEIAATSYFGTALTRTLYSTNQGAYVVVDKLSYGPSYDQLIGRFSDTTLSFGADNRLEVMNIYLRSDAMRLLEKSTLPHWRYVLNNWFGLVPFLNQILPPSFNPNEMYDPVKEITTPLSFPLSIKAFDEMPVGSIRSYAVTGGINVPIEFSNQVSEYLRKAFIDMGLGLSLPLSLFVGGTHRINILKKSPHKAWVGVTKETREGNRIYALLGQTFYIFSNTVEAFRWKGVKTVASPIEFEQINAALARQDILYEYDTASVAGARKFLRAIKGDFGSGKSRDTFLLKKDQESLENKTTNRNNIFVARGELNSLAQQSEVRIEEKGKVEFILESLLEFNNIRWDMILGAEEKSLNARSHIDVEKIDAPKGAFGRITPRLTLNSGNSYRLKGEDPYYLTCTYAIRSNQFGANDFNGFVNELENFTMLEIKQAKEIPEDHARSTDGYFSDTFFVRPDQTVVNTSPHNSPLGKFQAMASLYFSHDALKKLASLSEAVLWDEYAKTFELSEREKKDMAYGNTGTQLAYKALSFSLKPAHIFNLYFPKIDALWEINNAIVQIKSLEHAKNPKEVLSSLYAFLNTNYPKKHFATLVRLLDPNEVGKKVTFFIDPKDKIDPALKEIFAQLNKASFEGGRNFPPIRRYNVDPKKLRAFIPQKISQEKQHPSKVTSISIEENSTGRRLVRVYVKDVRKTAQLFVYVRLESIATFKLGTTVLGENVITANLKTDDDGRVYFRFPLTGEDSPLTNYFLTDLAIDKRYQLVVSLSENAINWSMENRIIFRIDNLGELTIEAK